MEYILRTWKDSDVQSLATHLNNKKIWDNCRDGLPFPYTEKDAIRRYSQQTDIIRLYVSVYEFNTASMRVLEKVGFKKTGIHHKACFKNEHFIDAHYYKLLKQNFVLDDWIDIK